MKGNMKENIPNNSKDFINDNFKVNLMVNIISWNNKINETNFYETSIVIFKKLILMKLIMMKVISLILILMK